MGDISEDWPRLAAFVVSARKAAGFRGRKALAAVCKVSDRTLDKLENGQRVSAATLAAIEPHLGWRPGSCQAILAGGQPIVTEADALAARLRRLPPHLQQKVSDLLAAVEGLAEPPSERPTSRGA